MNSGDSANSAKRKAARLAQLLRFLSQSLSFAGALEEFPDLEPKHLRLAMLRAAEAVEAQASGDDPARESSPDVAESPLEDDDWGEEDDLDSEDEAPIEKEAPAKSSAPADPETIATILVDVFFDGASKGNPGPSSIGYVIREPDGLEYVAAGEYIGTGTNNFAEYRGFLGALNAAREYGFQRLRVHSDSQLLVRQLQGRYQVKSPQLKPLYEQARKLMKEFREIQILHVPREENSQADQLANEALKPILKKKKATKKAAGGS